VNNINIKSLILPALTLTLWAYAFSADWQSVVQVWSSTETFTHCFLILPIVVYLAWNERGCFLPLSPEPNLWLIVPIAAVLFLGLLGVAGDIQLFSHLAMFSSLSLFIWMFVGNNIANALKFCLFFVLFSVPVGVELVPFFQQITASLAIYLLAFFDIPIYRDGLYISIPEGQFVVARACSGIRFFIACLAFGSVYAHMSFRKTGFKFTFMLIAIALPILANSVRVFGTIIIGHVFGMEHAKGTDHLAFGWGFFAFVMFLLFMCGELLRRFEKKLEGNVAISRGINQEWGRQKWQAPFSVAVISLMVFIFMRQAISDPVSLPSEINHKKLDEINVIAVEAGDWKPQFENASDIVFATQPQILGASSLDIYIAWYGQSRQGAELIAEFHQLFDTSRWSIAGTKKIILSVDGNNLDIKVIELTSGAGAKRLIAYWYEFSGGRSTSAIETKLYQAWDKLTLGSGAGAIVAVSVAYQDKTSEVEAQHMLRDFIIKNSQTTRDSLPFEKVGDE
jgi:exosortase A